MKPFSRTKWRLALNIVGWSLCSMGAAMAATVNVSVGNNFFSPSTSNININDTVMWNWSGNNHTSTSNSGLWDSGVRNSGATFSRQFTSGGSFPYRCTVHAGQNGTINVAAPNTPPTVTVTNPPNGSVFTAPASFTLGAAASDPGGSVTNVQFLRDATSLGNDTTSPYSVAVNNLSAGSYTLSAVASDNAGARATNSISITVQANTPPTVAITNPPNGAILTVPASFTLAASASDPGGSVTNVQFFRDTTSLGNDTTSPYSVPVNALAAGNYTLSAVASDNLGVRATNTIGIIVNVLPTVSIVSPTNGSIRAAPFGGTLQATATDSDGTIAKVEFFAGGTALGSVTSPPYTLFATNVGAGMHTLTAVSTDNLGATNTSAAVTVSVVTPVQVVLSGPQRLSGTQFRFSHTANAGLRYRIHRSPGMGGWMPIQTNVANSSLMTVLDAAATGPLQFYRVERLANP